MLLLDVEDKARPSALSDTDHDLVRALGGRQNTIPMYRGTFNPLRAACTADAAAAGYRDVGVERPERRDQITVRRHVRFLAAAREDEPEGLRFGRGCDCRRHKSFDMNT